MNDDVWKIIAYCRIDSHGHNGVVTLLGGISTTCVALDAAKYGSMSALASYQWLYILYVLVGIGIGTLGIWATGRLAKGKRDAYKLALITLISGLVVGGLHMATSRALRGSSMPVDFIVYITALTLVLFLLFRIPAIWSRLDLVRRDGGTDGLGVGVAMIVAGITILTVRLWAGPTHVINGINYADVWHIQLTAIGWIVAIAGGIMLAAGVLKDALPVSLRTSHQAGLKEIS